MPTKKFLDFNNISRLKWTKKKVDQKSGQKFENLMAGKELNLKVRPTYNKYVGYQKAKQTTTQCKEELSNDFKRTIEKVIKAKTDSEANKMNGSNDKI